MNAYEKIRAALEQAYKERHEPCSVELRIDEALAALSELEKAASEPVTYQYSHPSGGGKIWRNEQHWNGYTSDEARALYAAPPAPVAALAELERSAAEPVATVLGIVVEWTGEQPTAGTKLYTVPPAPVAEIRDVVVTDEMCDRAYIGKWRGVPELIGHEPDDEDRQWSREWLEAWRSELGPALGLVEIREPTPEECERICTEYERLLMREGTCGGRDAFDAVKIVMWPKLEGS